MDALLTPVADWMIGIENWFDNGEKTNLRKNELTFDTVEKIVKRLRRTYPQSTVTAVTVDYSDHNLGFISTSPLEMERDEDKMTSEEFNKKWYPDELFV